ncbi:MAG: OmpA family protein [Myxococcota bacterium]
MYEADEDEGGAEGAPAWMATFADLSTLLLTFFVLLLSFANMDVIEFKAALGSVKNALGVVTKRPGELEGSSPTPINFEDSNASSKSDKGLPNELIPIHQMIRNKNMDGSMKLIVTEKNIILRVNGLFPSGTAELQPEDFVQLDIINALCRLYAQPIMVEAHTDDRAISSPIFPSNWELSAHRAAAVARYLERAGRVDPERISPSGYGPWRPLVPNDSPANRAENRRVDIILARKRDVPIQMNDSGAW